MRTNHTESFEKSFLHGLAGVSRRKSRKQVLQNIVTEALNAVDMAKGLQGRGDWHGAATKVSNSASLLDQAIDLAETLPGVNFERTRKQANLVVDRLKSTMHTLDTDPLDSRDKVRSCAVALAKAIEVVRMFADRLQDDIVIKSGDSLPFDEDYLIKEVDKVALTGRSGEGPGAATRQRIGQQAGIFTTSSSGGSWENVPGKAGRQRRKKADGSYEYRDAATSDTVAASIDADNVRKEDDDDEEEESDVDLGPEDSSELPQPKKLASKDTEEEATVEEKSIDPSVLFGQANTFGQLAKGKK